ncbi:MAG TPA: copper resistance protein CopC [Acidobacteriaceae bacterium]|nr:copper resistance protein CopC [Acidobacteriaceae bacterium]
MTRFLGWAGALTLMLLAGSPAAFAHAMLVHSSPADQAVVRSRQVNIALDYDSRIEARRCTVKLTDAAGKPVALQMEQSAKPSELNAVAHGLANGKYQIHWQVLASDGHITRGDVSFTVAAQ